MASVAVQKPAVDYFSLSTQRPQNTTFSPSPFVWDSSPYDIALPSPESCDSILPSPTSPTLPYPNYKLPKAETPFPKEEEQAFNFGSFDDWMGWDEHDPADNALSPVSDFFPELKVEPSSPNMGDLNLQPSGFNPTSSQTTVEDSAVFGNDDMADGPFFQTPTTTQAQQPAENLYSTPLSWTPPQPSTRRFTRLSPEQESELRSIAMPSTSRAAKNSNAYPASPSSVSSPEPNSLHRKRKSSVEEECSDDDETYDRRSSSGSGRHPPVKKTAHNMIEKRYRTNLNDKIAALRDSVPALRVVTRKNSRGEDVEREEDLQGLTPAHKLNKATVLSKATEYIAHLEKRNKFLTKENTALKSRVEAFEILMLARQSPNPNPNPSSKPAARSRQGSSRYGNSMDGLLS
jgi:hypothetical protein